MGMVVIGGGHAGIEAANIAARMGVATTLLTMNLDQIGQMSCNPSIGGVGKGHMVRELDALGGAMGRLADTAGIHFRILNASRGVAVRGPRAQADRVRYRIAARRHLEHTPRLRPVPGRWPRAALAARAPGGLEGVELLDGSFLPCRAVVVTSGTFLNGRILIGERKLEAGRAGEPPSTHLAEQLRALGLRWRRLKTGTSPRIAAGSIDFSRLEAQPGDPVPGPSASSALASTCPRCPATWCTPPPRPSGRCGRTCTGPPCTAATWKGWGPATARPSRTSSSSSPTKPATRSSWSPIPWRPRRSTWPGSPPPCPRRCSCAWCRACRASRRPAILRPGYAIEYDSFDPLQLGRDLAVTGWKGSGSPGRSTAPPATRRRRARASWPGSTPCAGCGARSRWCWAGTRPTWGS